MKKQIFTLAICFFALAASAADDTQLGRGIEQLSRSKQELDMFIRRLSIINPQLSTRLALIKQGLDIAESTLRSSIGYTPIQPAPIPPTYPPSYPPNYPPQNELLLSGTCEVDDDADFTAGQGQAGEVQGVSVDHLMGECNVLAQAQGAREYSYMVSKVKVLRKAAWHVTATCQIDDDADFTYDQVVVGELAGANFTEVMRSCKKVAALVYKGRGSAGIKNPQADYNFFQVTADCHIDDDVDFTEGQIVFGKLGGYNVQDLVRECSELAHEMYGKQGSSGLRNVVQRPR
jgi:hypothetical protein